MSLTREWLIVEYSDDSDVETATYTFTTRQLLEMISKATSTDELPEIAVYEIGDCVIDWS